MSCLRKITAAVVLTAVITQTASAYQLLDSNYTAQNYASYQLQNAQLSKITLDSMGNIYTSAWGLADGASGEIYKTDTYKNTSLFASGFNKPTKMVYMNNLDYGNYLYVSDWQIDTIWKVDMTGNKSVFLNSNESLYALGYDSTGYFDHKLYVGTRSCDRILSLSKGGDTQILNNLYGAQPGGPVDLEIDSTNQYGNAMYISYVFEDEHHRDGIYSLNNQNQLNKFVYLRHSGNIEFDNYGLFDNKMIVSGYNTQTVGRHIFKLSSDGSLDPFIDTESKLIQYTFDNQGALYLAYMQDDVVKIDKITPIPEPASLLVLSLGLVILKRK